MSYKREDFDRIKTEFENKRIGYKLNSPYIHQLRQRFIAFYGKYGKSLNDIAIMVTREETYTNIGDDTQRNLVPLGAVGDNF